MLHMCINPGGMALKIYLLASCEIYFSDALKVVLIPHSALCFAQATQKNQTLADEMIMKTMVKAGHRVRDQWEKHHIRKLDTLTTIRRWPETEAETTEINQEKTL